MPSQRSPEGHMRMRQREMRKTRIKGIAFDLDDTTWWQGEIWRRDLRAVLVDYGITLSARQLSKYMGGRIVSKIVEEFDLDEDPAEVSRKVNERHLETMREGVTLTPGVTRTFRRLQGMGFVLGAATSGWNYVVHPRLEQTRISEYIPADRVVTRNDVQHLKPHPEPINKVADQMGIETRELLYVGNEPTDVRAAREAGAWSGLVTHGRHWRYKSSRPDILLSSLYNLPTILARIGVGS